MAEYKLKPETTFADLRVRYGTGRAYTVFKGQEKVSRYRIGMMTRLGDIERSEWVSLIKALIVREKEEDLQAHLREWCGRDPMYRDKADQEIHTLTLHAARIFDDEKWVDFVPFNQKYRPEVLAKTELVQVINTCCRRPGWVTKTLAMRHYGGIGYCPRCGRYTEFEIITGGETNAEKRNISSGE